MKSENLFTSKSIRTYTGEYVNVFDPDPDTINIIDIAHSLSQQCRFGGHLSEFYSVASHSILVSRLVSEKYALQALLHDATEAYILDLPSPIKKEILSYKVIEEKLWSVIATKFNIDIPLHISVLNADKEMLHKEWNYLMLNKNPQVKMHLMRYEKYAGSEFLKEFWRLYSIEFTKSGKPSKGSEPLEGSRSSKSALPPP